MSEDTEEYLSINEDFRKKISDIAEIVNPILAGPVNDLNQELCNFYENIQPYVEIKNDQNQFIYHHRQKISLGNNLKFPNLAMLWFVYWKIEEVK